MDKRLKKEVYWYFSDYLSKQKMVPKPPVYSVEVGKRDPLLFTFIKYSFSVCVILLVFFIPRTFFLNTDLGSNVYRLLKMEGYQYRIEAGAKRLNPNLFIEKFQNEEVE